MLDTAVKLETAGEELKAKLQRRQMLNLEAAASKDDVGPGGHGSKMAAPSQPNPSLRRKGFKKPNGGRATRTLAASTRQESQIQEENRPPNAQYGGFCDIYKYIYIYMYIYILPSVTYLPSIPSLLLSKRVSSFSPPSTPSTRKIGKTEEARKGSKAGRGGITY
jgi:hypothetical protein